MRKTRLCFRLAAAGIARNRKLYLPYLLTCVGMVMMFYILHSLSYAPALREMAGGDILGLILSLGRFVIAVFAVLFLFYTNSFLIRRRCREFGLYNVLGMDKRTLYLLVLLEALITSVPSLLLGLVLGIAFSKIAELSLVNIIHAEVDYSLTVSPACIGITVSVMGVIFLLLAVRSVLQVRFSDPLELLRSENTGEKPPKANYPAAAAGALLLGAAYTMAVRIKSPIAALTWFFAAVIMVIIATYLMFISGSVALCRLLQKNKSYYYQKQHFVSVANMVYRMKRNGAGLASICILATMVLVMISSSSGLYFGAEDSLHTMYPCDNNFKLHVQSPEDLTGENLRRFGDTLLEAAGEVDAVVTGTMEYRYAYITGLQTNGEIDPDSTTYDNVVQIYDDLRQLFFLDVNEYNAVMGTSCTVAPGEALLGEQRCRYEKPELNLGGLHLKVAGKVAGAFPQMDAASAVVPSIFVVVSDLSQIAPLAGMKDSAGRDMLELTMYFGCNIQGDDAGIVEAFEHQEEAVTRVPFLQEMDGYGWGSACSAGERMDFYYTYGGLFFLGILLSLVFIAATVLIIYYKQVSEGYEDRGRFAIMQKVGMTKEDIRRSINSQVLTVFFAPLLTAGLHLAFAFPLVWKLLQLFGLNNLGLVLLTTGGSFLAFSILYAVVYKVTAGAYYGIVSGAGNEMI